MMRAWPESFENFLEDVLLFRNELTLPEKGSTAPAMKSVSAYLGDRSHCHMPNNWLRPASTEGFLRELPGKQRVARKGRWPIRKHKEGREAKRRRRRNRARRCGRDRASPSFRSTKLQIGRHSSTRNSCPSSLAVL